MPSRRRGKHTTTDIITLLAPPSRGGNPISQAFGAFGQALQSGNLPSAQQAYATLQQDLQQYLPDSSSSATGTTASSLPAPGGSVSVTAWPFTTFKLSTPPPALRSLRQARYSLTAHRIIIPSGASHPP